MASAFFSFQSCKEKELPQAICGGVEADKEARMILRRKSVEQLTGLSRSTLYAMMSDGDFPKPVRLGKRAVGWREADITQWLENLQPSAE